METSVSPFQGEEFGFEPRYRYQINLIKSMKYSVRRWPGFVALGVFTTSTFSSLFTSRRTDIASRFNRVARSDTDIGLSLITSVSLPRQGTAFWASAQ